MTDHPNISEPNPAPQQPAPKRRSSWFGWMLILLAVGIVYGSVQYREWARENADQVAWLTNIDVGLATGVETDKLILLEFTSKTCGPCQMMKQNVFSDNEVAATLNEQFIPVRIEMTKLNNNQAAQLLGQYSVNATPTFVIVKGNGEVIGREVGYLDKPVFLQWLRQVQARNTQAIAIPATSEK
ncbi:thioredoxin family protein [Poriferisphaera sp. WC338]|uniref:thioredoxin family protein n=1 Tax=Poriferisphaera sp. WC338 TaxID=3425129 RepID=UPI003D8191E7